MANDLEEKKPPALTTKKPRDIEEGELVLVLKQHYITNYNRYVKNCMDKHKEERKKVGKETSFEDAKDLMDDCATEWNKLSEEEKKKWSRQQNSGNSQKKTVL